MSQLLTPAFQFDTLSGMPFFVAIRHVPIHLGVEVAGPGVQVGHQIVRQVEARCRVIRHEVTELLRTEGTPSVLGHHGYAKGMRWIAM
ncbi:hypothetical protein ADK86_02090 [Streptomyces sp. NRRL F-5755]|nr:hypothetical protein ADK86_02090 [Streptomyces sp. NRRL F-5755]